MTVPHIIRIGALVLATTGFYAYVGQMVPQKEVQPPQEIVLRTDLTTADMVKVGREIMEGKGLCITCHTIGKTGALRFPDLEGVDVRAESRVPGLSDVEYFAQSMYEPDAYIVQGFNPGMPVINKPPIGLTDQEILCVIAYLQSLGGTPTVTLQTTHRYRAAAAPPGGAPAAPGPGEAQPLAAPKKGAQLRPGVGAPQARPAGVARLRQGSGEVSPKREARRRERGNGAPAPRQGSGRPEPESKGANDGAGGSGRLRAVGASASLAGASAEAGGAKPPGLSER